VAQNTPAAARELGSLGLLGAIDLCAPLMATEAPDAARELRKRGAAKQATAGRCSLSSVRHHRAPFIHA